MTQAYISESPSFLGLLRARFRAGRARIFRQCFSMTPDTRILDLGGSNGAHIASVLAGTATKPVNCIVADCDRTALNDAQARFGFRTVELSPSDSTLPFSNKAFDIVFCSSVLEHVTFSRPEVWSITDGPLFHDTALRRQSVFAAEIRRVGLGYFVQVPYRHFPVETHTRLPLFQYLRRQQQVSLMRSEHFRWLRQVTPDFYLPTRVEFQAYFPDAMLKFERLAGLVKSLIALKPARPDSG